jgi:hypothetical protein
MILDRGQFLEDKYLVLKVQIQVNQAIAPKELVLQVLSSFS